MKANEPRRLVVVGTRGGTTGGNGSLGKAAIIAAAHDIFLAGVWTRMPGW